MKHSTDSILKADQAAYLEALEPTRDPVLAKMEALAKERNLPISDPEVASFLAVTARIAQPRLVVEVGTNIGYGAIVLARAAGPAARVVTLEISPEMCELARGFAKEARLDTRIEVVTGDALVELEKLSGPIDLAYIDCVKEHYTRYLELIVPKLSPHGAIVADNVLWRGLVAADQVPESERVRTEALRAFNKALTTHPLLRAVILPLGDGVAYAVRHTPS